MSMPLNINLEGHIREVGDFSVTYENRCADGRVRGVEIEINDGRTIRITGLTVRECRSIARYVTQAAAVDICTVPTRGEIR